MSREDDSGSWIPEYLGIPIEFPGIPESGAGREITSALSSGGNIGSLK
jgi:hypothetical protein